jgi:hypothetical protein
MPITGHFEADFSAFNDGVKTATAALAGLEADSKDAGKALDQMGATTPATVKAITTETKAATSSLIDLGGVTRQIGGMLAGAFTVQQIANFGAAVFEAADAIGTMAAKTGMSTDEVQKLQFIAQQSSVSVGALSGAAQQLQADIGSNNAGVVRAVGDLNINLDEFKKLSAYDQFVQLSAAVAGIEDPYQRAAEAEAIFHKNWKEIYPAMKAEIQDLGDQAPVLKEKYVQNLNEIENAWKHLKTETVNAGGAILGSLAETNKEFDAQVKASQDWAAIQASADAGLSVALAAIPPLQTAVATGFQAITLSAEDAKIQQDSWGAAATATMEQNKAAADATKAAYDELAKAFEKQNAEIETATRAHWEEVAKLQEDAFGTPALKRAATWSDAITGLNDDVGRLSAKMRDDLGATMRDALEAMARNGTLTDEAADRYTDLMLKVDAYNASLKAQADTILPAASGAVTDYTRALYQQAIAEDAVRNAQAGVGGPSGNVGGSTDGSVYTSPTGNQGGSVYVPFEANSATSGSGAGSSYYVPPARAAGGPVAAGTSYLVGEKGPELYTPGASGVITPNGAGATVVQNTFHLVDTESNLARRVSDLIMRSVLQARRV